MAENEGYKLLDQLADEGVEKVNFVGGEPMLHPHIEAWIIYAKRLGMVTSIVSNGTNIDEDFPQWLAQQLKSTISRMDHINQVFSDTPCKIFG